MTGSNTGLSIASDGQVTISQNNPTLTLGTNTTFPTKVTDRSMWYYMFNGESAIDYYLTSNNLDESLARMNGCAPTNFTSVVEMKAYFISSGSDPGVWSPVTFSWMIGSDGNSYQQHSKVVAVSTSGNFGASAIRELDIFNAGNDGSDFEDLIASNDVFGMRFSGINYANFLAGVGVKITWRF